MKRLNHAIEEQRRQVLAARRGLAIHGRGMATVGRRLLGSPIALAGGFGVGLALGLRRGQPPGADEPAAVPGWLIHDLVLPLVLGWLNRRED